MVEGENQFSKFFFGLHMSAKEYFRAHIYHTYKHINNIKYNILKSK